MFYQVFSKASLELELHKTWLDVASFLQSWYELGSTKIRISTFIKLAFIVFLFNFFQ
ncbi:hypothetical protein BD408DRAFT_414408 [Parasitella parasitica]|nr:hypothetical protein BD408DRAFT_414408 [Parasitella parasitica]